MEEYPHIRLIHNALHPHFEKSNTPIDFGIFVKIINSNPNNFDQFVVTVNRLFSGSFRSETFEILKQCYHALFHPVFEYIKEQYKVEYDTNNISESFAKALEYTRNIITAYSASRGRTRTDDIQQAAMDCNPSSYSIKYPKKDRCSWKIQRGERAGESCSGFTVSIVYKDVDYPIDYCKACVLKKTRALNDTIDKYPQFDITVVATILKAKRQSRVKVEKNDKKSKDRKTVDKRQTRVLFTPLQESGYHFLEEIGLVAKVCPKTSNLEIIGKLHDEGTMSEVKVVRLSNDDDDIIIANGYNKAVEVTDEEIQNATRMIVNRRTSTYIMKANKVLQEEGTFLRFHTTLVCE